MDTMRVWQVAAPGRLAPARRPFPQPGPDEILVRVLACGVCRTDLHVRDGDLPPHRPKVVPGHEAVGRVEQTGTEAAAQWSEGQLVGVPWLRHVCGRCRYCLRGDENLCPESTYTGWDADGGYAEYVVARAAFAYELPPGYDELELAPLLCAGIIGYRALTRANVPTGGRLGIYGFGASAHLTAQVAMAQGATVHVLTRSAVARGLAADLGVASVGRAYDRPPEPLDSAILFAHVGDLVPVALEALDAGGTLSVAGIYLTDIPELSYQSHLFRERHLTSVTSNTRADGRSFLNIAARNPLRISVKPYPFDAADRALDDLAEGRVRGVAVLDLRPA